MKAEVEIVKCHGSSNDFVIVDEMGGTSFANEHDRSDFSEKVCMREGGVGSDGVLFISPSDNATCQMRMFNPDGTEAEMCGNGIRCVGRYVGEKIGSDKLSVQTMMGSLELSKVDPLYPGVHTYQTQIGPVSQAPASLPVTSEHPLINQLIPDLHSDFRFSAISVPNPHVVALVDSAEVADAENIGKMANANTKLFPKGVNVSLLQVVGADKLFAVTYERGAGITNSCGTAMSACAVIAKKLGVVSGDLIEVYNLGGKVLCEFSEGSTQYPLSLVGNATFTFSALIEVDTEAVTPVKPFEGQMFQEEIDAYASFEKEVNAEVEALRQK